MKLYNDSATTFITRVAITLELVLISLFYCTCLGAEVKHIDFLKLIASNRYFQFDTLILTDFEQDLEDLNHYREYGVALENFNNSDKQLRWESAPRRNSTQLVVILSSRNISTIYDFFIHVLNVNEAFKKEELRLPIYFIIWPELVEDINNGNDIYEMDTLNESNSESQVSLVNNLATQGLLVDSDVYILYSTANNATDILHSNDNRNKRFCWQEMYTVKSKSITHSYCIKSPQLDFYDLLRKNDRRKNFHRIEVSGTAMIGSRPPAADFIIHNGTLIFVGGFEVDVFLYLRDALNFTAVSIKGSGWVEQHKETNELMGMANQVLKGEADISISSSEILLHLVDRLDFLIPTYHSTMWPFFRQPDSVVLRNLVFNVFTVDLWLCLFSTWALIGLSLALLSWVKGISGVVIYEVDGEISSQAATWVVSTLCQQGWYQNPQSVTTKILFFIGVSLGLIIYTAFSAGLVAILAVTLKPINTFGDLVSYNFDMYSDKFEMKVHFSTEMLDAKLPSDPKILITEQNTSAALTKMLSSKAAILDISDSLYLNLQTYTVASTCNQSEDVYCEKISKVAVNQKQVKGGMFLEKQSPFKELFNYKIMSMFERGVRKRLMTHYLVKTGMKCFESNTARSNTATFHSFGVQEVFAAFSCLFIAYVVSLIIYIIERFVHYRQQSLLEHPFISTSSTSDRTLENLDRMYFSSKTSNHGLTLVRGRDASYTRKN